MENAERNYDEAYNNEPLKPDSIKIVYGEDSADLGITYNREDFLMNDLESLYKYDEDIIISDLLEYINSTYNQHYKSNDNKIECFDAWIALGDSTPTFRNTALKYLWRYGKKNGSNKADLMKALHYTMMCLYVDHYKDVK